MRMLIVAMMLFAGVALADSNDEAAKSKKLGYELKAHSQGAKKGPNGHYYLFVKGRMSWQEAFKKAKEMGGYLATATNKEELDFIVKISNLKASPSRVWLGGVIRKSLEIRWHTGDEGAPSKEEIPRHFSRHIGPLLTVFIHEEKVTLGGCRASGLNSKKKWTTKGFVIEWDK